ncbi:hypothetical protein G6F50_017311 [Rhizopus delemar]|uniref:Uncharacterized protein n=1 Tax=Rhizopus delemar TaxID=936053 RepID=A0A9P6XQS0_9FUNG|nr:hypothetical protein G6F50_017311 [Rhizopus delemar]
MGGLPNWRQIRRGLAGIQRRYRHDAHEVHVLHRCHHAGQGSNLGQARAQQLAPAPAGQRYPTTPRKRSRSSGGLFRDGSRAQLHGPQRRLHDLHMRAAAAQVVVQFAAQRLLGGAGIAAQ